MPIEIMTRHGLRSLDAAELAELRSVYTSTLVDLGTGDGAWPRRFAREWPHCLALGIDSDRDSLRQAAKLAERKPARGGAANARYIAASAESLPAELRGIADWLTIYFPWSALLRVILAGDDAVTEIVAHLASDRSRLSIVLNAEAPPEGFAPLTPAAVQQSLKSPLKQASFRVTRCEWLDASDAPPTTWSGRLVKGSKRKMIGLDALR